MILTKIKEFVKPSREILNNIIKLGKARSKFFYWVKEHQDDIILVTGVILISLFSFAIGYIVAKQQNKEPLRFEEDTYEKSKNSYNWGRDNWTLFSLEAFSGRL